MSLEVGITSSVGGFTLRVAFHAPPGITALFGPSGSGKTLTLRAVAGLASAARGRIVLDDRVLLDSGSGVDVPTRLRRIGYVFQQSALLPHLSVAKNVEFGIHAWPREARMARVAELLELVGLPAHGDRRPGGLSGGEQQRVALARALAPRPDLLLLDEPFAALDARVRSRLRAELLELHAATGVPMILVTHDLSEVRQLAGWLVVCDAGRTLGEGPVESLLGDPVDPALAPLLETP
jgi:molybdate transport system ATP-binding protein